MGLKAVSLETGAAQSKPRTTLSFRDDATEPLLNQRFQRRLLTLGELPSFIKDTISNMYGRLHMADHIAEYCDLSSPFEIRADGIVFG